MGICPAYVPSCPPGEYVLPKRHWNGCCFNRETDCVLFEKFAVFEMGIPASVDEGVLTENNMRRAIASLVHVNPHDVNVQRSVEVLTTQAWVVRTFAVAPSSNSTLESDPDVILTK